MSKTFYLTTPLYYVNAKPHIGHAYTNILCDTFARYRKLCGEKVFFLTGTDEHGTKIEKAAREQKKEPRQYVDEMAPQFNELWKLLGIEYDYFIRTTDGDHKEVVRNVLVDLEKRGEIYKANYKGWYCTPCESFWTELQLVEGKCRDCHREVQELAEENYFFRLSKYQDWLIKYIQEHPDFIRPEIRKNEILGFLRAPLEDLCISRPRSRLAWGIDYPTSKDHVVYVWFDALVNYVTAAGLTHDDKKFKTLWPADLHLVGKDILRQHAVYWPIMLKAMGVDMPKTVLAHGWWTMSGAKVSKSRGNAVDPITLEKKYGVDAFRYFLLHEVTLGLDGAFSEDLLAERYTTDLANDFGNLWFRFASMLEKYFEGVLPRVDFLSLNKELMTLSIGLFDKVWGMMEKYDPKEALNFVLQAIRRANQFVEEKKPWVLVKDPAKKSELESVMVALAEVIFRIAIVLTAFMPTTAHKILQWLGQPTQWKITPNSGEFSDLRLIPGARIQKGEILFPKLEEKI